MRPGTDRQTLSKAALKNQKKREAKKASKQASLLLVLPSTTFYWFYWELLCYWLYRPCFKGRFVFFLVKRRQSLTSRSPSQTPPPIPTANQLRAVETLKQTRRSRT